MGCLPEKGRIDVFAARQHQAGNVPQRRNGERRVDRRQDDRDQPDAREGVGVGLVDPNAGTIPYDLGSCSDDDEGCERHRSVLGCVATDTTYIVHPIATTSQRTDGIRRFPTVFR